jgi:hypothetical protein
MEFIPIRHILNKVFSRWVEAKSRIARLAVME